MPYRNEENYLSINQIEESSSKFYANLDNSQKEFNSDEKETSGNNRCKYTYN